MVPEEGLHSGPDQTKVPIAPGKARPSIASSGRAGLMNGGSNVAAAIVKPIEQIRPRSSQSSDRSQSSVSPSRTTMHMQAADSTTNLGHSSGSNSSLHNPRIKKTLADTIASHQGVAPPRKRKRVHYSCAECHRRKHKCDREIPCKPCVDRGIGDTCRPFSEGDEFGDERDRIKRLEDLVEGLARAHASLTDEMDQIKAKGGFVTLSDTKREGKAASTDGGYSDDEVDADGKAGRQTRPVMPTPIDIEREELRKGSLLSEEPGHSGVYGGASEEMLPSHNSLEGGLTREGDSFYGALALPSVSRGTIETQIHGERLELSANIPLRSASVKVHRLIQEGGAPANVIEELMGCLPPREVSDEMLDWYFRDINDTRLPLHERTFRASYEEIMQWRWGDLRSEEGDDGARHIPFLSFLFVILALAKRSEPEERCTDEEARRGALFFLHCARRSMAIASAVRADHIDVLLGALFGARLLITLRQSAESWSLLGVAIRAAQAIGLHRDGTKLGLDAVTTERRRRLWALIYYLDRTTSMLLGRPQAIDDKTTDCLPPCDVDIDVLPRMGPAPTPEPFPPLTPPNAESLKRPPGVYRFIAIRHELAKLTGRVVEHFQDLSKPRNYAEVLKIDYDLQKFYAAIPPPYMYEALQGKGTDRSFDEICPWLPIHRYLLNLEYHYVRITLHRPYLLRSVKYRQSREAAFASAKADRLIRREYKKQVQWPTNRARNSHLGGVYRLFSSTLIAGIELLLDPNSSSAPELHEMLDDFLNSNNKVADQSQCTKRELAIIKIFKAKAMDPTWCAATATGGKESQKESATAGSRTKQVKSMSLGGKPSASGQLFQGAPAALESPSQRSDNELAQTLLDRLGGLETFGVLNQSQSPSSNTSTSHEVGSIGMGVNMGLVPSFNAMGGETPSSGTQGGTSMMAYNVPNLDNLFDPSLAFEGQDNDWASFTNGNTGDLNLPWDISGDGKGQAAAGSSVPVSKDGREFGGWGILVEAIASGKEGGEDKMPPPT